MTDRPALVVDLGMVAYEEAVALQREMATRRVSGAVPDMLLLCQHPGVITIGRAGGKQHLREGAYAFPVVEVERGGDVTYHGPGQLVGYPILALEGAERDLHRFLRSIEEVILRSLAGFGIAGERIAGLTGVWVGNHKLCAIGVAVRRWVTLHGFALNVSVNLEPFDRIIPCGLHGCGVTSMERLLGASASLAEVQAELTRHFGIVFSRALRFASPEEIVATEERSNARW